MIELSVANLIALDRKTAPPLPFALVLRSVAAEADVRYECEALLRVLPGRRVVLKARLGGEQLVLKLFIGRQRHRYFARERRGLRWLSDAEVPSARLRDEVRGPGLVGLVLDYLPEAAPLEAGDQQGMERTAALLARMHLAGIRQDDLHLRNFVLCDRQPHAVDGDGVRRERAPLAIPAALDNLARLGAQRPPLADEMLGELLEAYRRIRDLPSAGTDGLERLVSAARRRRMTRYERKTRRSCTEFAVRHGWRRSTFVVRGEGEECLARLLEDPSLPFAGGSVIKAGNSATLVTAGALVIKRYNVKTPGHRFRRSMHWLPRYRRAWSGGQVLHLLGIPTARPLALLEERAGPLRGVSYLVMPRLEGPDLGTEVREDGLTDRRCEETARLLLALKAAGLSHGDTKATNFVVHEDRLHLVDLDALRLDGRGSADDVARFLDNWEPPERERFEASFRATGLI